MFKNSLSNFWSFGAIFLIAVAAPPEGCNDSDSPTGLAMPSVNVQKPSFNRKGKQQNQLDSLKFDQNYPLSDVSSVRVVGDATLVFDDGSRMSPGDSPKRVQSNSIGWVNPNKGLVTLHTQSKGEAIRIKADGGNDVFGKLEFSKVHEGCSSLPAGRSYRIEIDSLDVARARNGDLVVLYEYYPCDPDTSFKSSAYTSWVLWISDTSF